MRLMEIAFSSLRYQLTCWVDVSVNESRYRKQSQFYPPHSYSKIGNVPTDKNNAPGPYFVSSA